MVSQLLLPAIAGSSFKQSSNNRFARFNRGEDRGLNICSGPAIPLPAPLSAGLTLAPTVAVLPPEPVFAYDNIKWQRVPAMVRREGLLAVENLMDQMAAYFIGEMTETDFEQAVRSFRNKMFKTAPTPMMPPPPAPAPKAKRQQQQPSGVRLGKLLKEWLDISAAPVREVYEAEPWKYTLYDLRGKDGLLIQRRSAKGYSFLTGGAVTSRQEAQAVIADLEKQFKQQAQRPVITREGGSIDGRQVQMVIERGPITQTSKTDDPDQATREAFTRGFNAQMDKMRAAQAKRAAYTANPFERKQ